MKQAISVFFITAAFIFLQGIAPKTATADDLIVENNPTDTSHFSTIQAAINYANNLLTGSTPTTTSFRVFVEPGTYSGPITPISNVPILGRETARTFISGGSGALITMNNATNVTIQNFTIINAAIGISISNSTTIKIASNVFQVGTSGTAVQVQNSSSATIVNNTFYQNGTAISTNSDILITNNIFSTNGTAISSQVPMTQITYNDYYNNTTIGTTPDVHSIPNITVTNPNPLFVDLAKLDFHLKEGSPCIINAGNPSYPNVFDASTFDMGAFGGTNTDTIPFPVSGITSSITTTAPYSISLGWAANTAYTVKGYKVYYGNASGVYTGTGATEGNSPITVPTGTTATTTTLSGLISTAVTPASPVLYLPQPLNESLNLSWSAVTGATGYKIYYSTSSFGLSSLPSTSIDVPNTTSYALSGLTNGQTYYIAVSATTQATYYIAITAFDATTGLDPGKQHESAYSAEAVVQIGSTNESDISNVVSDFPEAVIPYPNLPNKGCFIATAAYGYYSAPEVQALRKFRDRYLITNSLGNAFVNWYYEHGPAAAAYLNAHPGYKPLVRAALWPAIGAATFMTGTSFLVKIGALLVMGLVFAFGFYKITIFKHRRASLKTLIVLLFSLILLPTVTAHAADTVLDRPHWSLEIKGGRFAPVLENWAQYYGKRSMPEYAATLAYKILRPVELGVGVGSATSKGHAYAPLHNIMAGDVTLDLFPVNVFVLLRGVVNENQWVVPYVGGGWTRMYYQERVQDQEKVRGSADGYHVRGGLQISLDSMDQSAANSLYLDYSIHHTYLFVEAERTKAKVKSVSVDLGGTAYLFGLLFEF